MAQNILNMKFVLFSIIFLAFLVRLDGFYLNKVTKGSKHTTNNFLKTVQPKEMEQKEFLDDFLYEQRPGGYGQYGAFAGDGDRGRGWNIGEVLGLIRDKEDETRVNLLMVRIIEIIIHSVCVRQAFISNKHSWPFP